MRIGTEIKGPFLALDLNRLPPKKIEVDLADPAPQGAAEGLEILPYAKGAESPPTRTEEAVEPEGISEELAAKLQCLGPQVMCWEPGVWLIALGATESYWRDQARLQGLGLLALWRKVLDVAFGEGDWGGAPYRAALASHPFKALLLVYAESERGLSGLVTEPGRRGSELWRRVSWEVWQKVLSGVGNSLEKAKVARFQPAAFRKQSARFRLAAHKLGLDNPWAASLLSSEGVKNRYGVRLAALWGLSFGKPIDLDDPFVWIEQRFGGYPETKRLLDFSVAHWGALCPFLIEDLDRLGQLAAPKQALKIEWRLTLEDMREILVPLEFRHPQSLLAEPASQKTILAQAELRYLEAIKGAFGEDGERSEVYLEPPNLIGWRLTLSDALVLPDLILDLFGGQSQEMEDLEALASLENSLAVPLLRFGPAWDWRAEDGYGPLGSLTGEGLEFLPALQASAQARPLLVLENPRPVEPPRRGVFLESQSDHWWSASAALARDYYRVQLAFGAWGWWFEDETGQWYEQGSFG